MSENFTLPSEPWKANRKANIPLFLLCKLPENSADSAFSRRKDASIQPPVAPKTVGIFYIAVFHRFAKRLRHGQAPSTGMQISL
jgi:hypothetical protein